MAWVSPKVYAILINDDDGKDIIERLPDMSEEECKRVLDEFFGNSGYSSSKDSDEGDANESSSSSDASETTKRMSEYFTSIWGADSSYRVSGNPQMREKFRKAILGRESLNPELEAMIAETFMATSKVEKVYIRKDRNSSFSPLDRYVEIGGVESHSPEEILRSFSHEMGHAMDLTSWGRWKSSSFVSPKHGKTMSDMIYDEIGALDERTVKGYVSKMKSVIEGKRQEATKRFKSQEIGWEEYCRLWYEASNEYNSVFDILEGSLYEKMGSVGGNFGHGRSYWEEDPKVNRGTELFAEIVESYVGDKERHTIRFLEECAPKSLEIFHEIIESQHFGSIRESLRRNGRY